MNFKKLARVVDTASPLQQIKGVLEEKFPWLMEDAYIDDESEPAGLLIPWYRYNSQRTGVNPNDAVMEASGGKYKTWGRAKSAVSKLVESKGFVFDCDDDEDGIWIIPADYVPGGADKLREEIIQALNNGGYEAIEETVKRVKEVADEVGPIFNVHFKVDGTAFWPALRANTKEAKSKLPVIKEKFPATLFDSKAMTCGWLWPEADGTIKMVLESDLKSCKDLFEGISGVIVK